MMENKRISVKKLKGLTLKLLEILSDHKRPLEELSLTLLQKKQDTEYFVRYQNEFKITLDESRVQLINWILISKSINPIVKWLESLNIDRGVKEDAILYVKKNKHFSNQTLN